MTTYTMLKDCEDCEGKPPLSVHDVCRRCAGQLRVPAEISYKKLTDEYRQGLVDLDDYLISSPDFSKFIQDYLKRVDDDKNMDELDNWYNRGLEKAKQIILEVVGKKNETL